MWEKREIRNCHWRAKCR